MERRNSLGLDVIDVSLVAPPPSDDLAMVTHRGDDTRLANRHCRRYREGARQ